MFPLLENAPSLACLLWHFQLRFWKQVPGRGDDICGVVSLGTGMRTPHVPWAFWMTYASVCPTFPGQTRGSVILGATWINSLATGRATLESLWSQAVFSLPRSLSCECRKCLGCAVIPVLRVKMLRITLLPCLMFSIFRPNAFIWVACKAD